MDGLMPSPFPADAMEWATASTQDSTSWIHIDDHGLATVSCIRAGFKYWVLAVPKQKKAKGGLGGLSGNMGSIKAFDPKGWTPQGACDKLWDFEGVLLAPGDVL